MENSIKREKKIERWERGRFGTKNPLTKKIGQENLWIRKRYEGGGFESKI